jgi:hypothetical protein
MYFKLTVVPLAVPDLDLDQGHAHFWEHRNPECFALSPGHDT